jgi:hypothetical protein
MWKYVHPRIASHFPIYIYIYICGDYSVIDDRIIFCTYSVLLTTHVYTALYDRFILLVCKFWIAYLYLRSYLFEFVNHFSELCKWYTIGKLRKIHNFFILKLFSNFQWFKFNFENQKHSKTRLKHIFNLFSKPQIRITHMIPHWKAIEIAQLCYLCKFFQIRHAFWTILKILKFRSIQKWAYYNLSRFSQRFVGMMQIIWCWIDMEQTQLFHVLSFFKFCTIFE